MTKPPAMTESLEALHTDLTRVLASIRAARPQSGPSLLVFDEALLDLDNAALRLGTALPCPKFHFPPEAFQDGMGTGREEDLA